MHEFKKGQRVRIETEWTGEIASSGILTILVAPDEGGSARMVNLSKGGCKVTVLDPADWPPQVGDIWEANGLEWFVRKISPSSPNLIFHPEDSGYQWDPEEIKALNPVLVRRRGQ